VDISMSDQAAHSHGRQLDRNPPRPPRSRQSMSMMDMATGGDGDSGSQGLDTSNPAVQVMKAMGDAKNSLLKLSSLLPTLAQGIQQIIAGLEQVVPQQVADIVSGNAPGSGGSGMGSPQASAAPTAPPVQSGMQ
jgi:hypothetical protein